MQCGIIVPRQEDVLGLRADHYIAECVLEYAHDGPHVFKTPEGAHIAWEDDDDCGCCEPDEDDPCFVYWKVDGSDITKLTKRRT